MLKLPWISAPANAQSGKRRNFDHCMTDLLPLSQLQTELYLLNVFWLCSFSEKENNNLDAREFDVEYVLLQKLLDGQAKSTRYSPRPTVSSKLSQDNTHLDNTSIVSGKFSFAVIHREIPLNCKGKPSLVSEDSPRSAPVLPVLRCPLTVIQTEVRNVLPRVLSSGRCYVLGSYFWSRQHSVKWLVLTTPSVLLVKKNNDLKSSAHLRILRPEGQALKYGLLSSGKLAHIY